MNTEHLAPQGHTPTPWFVHEYHTKDANGPLYSIGSEYRDLTGEYIAVAVGIVKREDAELIVKAVNARQSQRIAELEAIGQAAAELRKEDCGAWLKEGSAGFEARCRMMKKLDALYAALCSNHSEEGRK